MRICTCQRNGGELASPYASDSERGAFARAWSTSSLTAYSGTDRRGYFLWEATGVTRWTRNSGIAA